MVKVKALINFANSSVTNGFNHPMVKVKDILAFKQQSNMRVSTTLW